MCIKFLVCRFYSKWAIKMNRLLLKVLKQSQKLNIFTLFFIVEKMFNSIIL